MLSIARTKYLSYLCITKQKVNIMNTYNITDVLYEEIAERCADNANFSWDVVETEDGYGIVFKCKNGRPYDIEVLDEENNDPQPHNFDLARYERIAANL